MTSPPRPFDDIDEVNLNDMSPDFARLYVLLVFETFDYLAAGQQSPRLPGLPPADPVRIPDAGLRLTAQHRAEIGAFEAVVGPEVTSVLACMAWQLSQCVIGGTDEPIDAELARSFHVEQVRLCGELARAAGPETEASVDAYLADLDPAVRKKAEALAHFLSEPEDPER